MHYDLTVANSSTWYWWLAVSPYDYKDGLVYIDKNKTNGNLTDSKLLWAMGNFSRFIRPGMGRYNVIRSDNNLNESVYSGLMVSGYAPEDQSQGIFVLVNYSETVNYPVKVKTIDNRIPKSVKSYITSAKSADNLRFADISNADEVITIPARSVVTIILDF
jgi:O-glycosyl hydrolase